MKSEIKKHGFSDDRKLQSVFKYIVESSREAVEIMVDHDYSLYPYISIAIFPIEPLDNDYDLVGVGIVELIVDVNALSKSSIDIERDVKVFRVVCDHGWLYYGYTPVRSFSGVSYVEKRWMHILSEGLGYEIVEIDEELEKAVKKILDRVLDIARDTLASEGLF